MSLEMFLRIVKNDMSNDRNIHIYIHTYIHTYIHDYEHKAIQIPKSENIIGSL